MSEELVYGTPRLLTGVTNAGLHDLAVDLLADREPGRVWIASDQRVAANRLLYQLLEHAPSGAVGGVERGTLFQLAVRLALPELAVAGQVPATRLGIEAGVLRALRASSDALSELADLSAAPGLPQRLALTLTELRDQRVDPQALTDVPSTGPDLQRILDHYSRGLEDAGILDRAAVYDTAVRQLELARPLPFDRLLAFDQPLRSATEERFVAALATAGIDCCAVVLAADAESVERYQRAFGVEAIPSGPGGRTSTGLDRLRSGLFSEQRQEPVPEDDSVQVLAASGEDREAVEVVRRIQQAADAGTTWDQIGVVLRNPDLYQTVFEDAFARAKIAAWFSRGTLRPDPGGRAFLALLSCRAEGYSATRFSEYLSLGQVPLEGDDINGSGAGAGGEAWLPSLDSSVEPVANDSEGAQLSLDFETTAPDRETAVRPSFPRRWEHLLVEASVIGGYERWSQRLEGLEHELEARLEHVRGDDPTRARAVAARLAQVRNLQHFALPLIDHLSRLPDEADVGEWIPALEALARQALRRPRRVLTLLADLRPMAGVGVMRFGEVRQLLAERLGQLRLPPEGAPYGRVFVGTPEEFRGLSFSTVFVCGLAEGIFPRRVREDPLLLDAARESLDAGLQVNARRVEEERLRLQIAAAAASERMTISYPTWDGLIGRARVPSFYAFDTAAAAWGRIEPLTSVSTRSPVDSDPGLAIDAAEFDVATLQPLLGTDRSPKGRCNYLMDASPHLARSLRTRGRRWLNFLSPVDGLVADPDGSELPEMLTRYRLKQRPYSPTSLQHYATCPYRFYLHGILRLRPREEAVDLEQLDPLTRGSLYHAIQFEFLRGLADDDALDFRDDREPDLLERLDAAIESVAGRYAERLRPALPTVYQGEVDDLRTDLRGWLRQVVADSEYTPSLFELSFGLPMDGEHDPASSIDPVLILDRLQAKGSIDMVERGTGGVVRVTDHKTGKARDARVLTVGGGEALQPLIYAWVAEDLLAAPVSGGRLWYSTRRGGYRSLVAPTGDFQRQSLETVLDTIDASIGDGFLPAAPREKACTWCDYRVVCGPHEELRLSIKTRNPETRKQLGALSHVRGME